MDTYSDILTVACSWGAALCVAALFALTVARSAISAAVRLLSSQGAKGLLLVPFTCMLVYVGSTKSRFTFDGGIANGTPPSYSTNDEIHITWVRDPHQAVPLPLDAVVYVDYRPNTATNEDWGLLAQTTVGAFGWEGELPDATNYDFNVWAYWIPPAPHTNGVWEWRTTYSRDGTRIVPFHARIEVGGKAISMPDQKRKDEEVTP